MVEDKTVLITGAAKRIGAEVAKFLISKGMNVIVHYNNSNQQALELKDKYVVSI